MTKLSPDGSALDYSTYLGGFNTSGFFDLGSGIAVDSSGAAYVTGDADSTNFPTTPGAFDTTQNGSVDAFVTKLNPAGSALDYSTFIGGTSFDSSTALAVDGSGNAYIAGYGTSSDYPTTAGAFDTSYNSGWDAFVTKLNASGTSLSYSTYLGGATYDEARGITVDGADSAYVTGHTFSSGYPTTPGSFRHQLRQQRRRLRRLRHEARRLGRGALVLDIPGRVGRRPRRGDRRRRIGPGLRHGLHRGHELPHRACDGLHLQRRLLRRLRHEAPHRRRVARLLDLPRRLDRRPRICDRCRRGDRHGLRRRADELLGVPDNRGSVRHQLQRRLRRVRDEAAPARLHPHQAGGSRGGPAEPSRLDRVRNRVDQRAAAAAPARHRAGRSRRLQVGRSVGADPGPGRRARGDGPEPPLHDRTPDLLRPLLQQPAERRRDPPGVHGPGHLRRRGLRRDAGRERRGRPDGVRCGRAEDDVRRAGRRGPRVGGGDGDLRPARRRGRVRLSLRGHERTRSRGRQGLRRLRVQPHERSLQDRRLQPHQHQRRATG